ncbi:hypothetical protein ANO11243_032620 [Dothideomycetidae sp. 11243]|nr:hypothetical protein ANO11243_032620 [fungal sp. No.11243]
MLRSKLPVFHIRLACLILTGQTTLAAQEARTLSDHLSRNTRPGQSAPATYLPWELRLLLHRLQSRMSADGRRSIMALYALGTECRARGASALHDEERRIWTDRLDDLGLRVAAELIEMGEFDAAGRHLHDMNSMHHSNQGLQRKALLQLRIGDIAAAEETMASMSAEVIADDAGLAFRGLMQLSNGDYSAAVDTYAKAHAARPHDVLVANNYAVSLLYAGMISTAASLLEALIDGEGTSPSPGVLFNLATFYELATERAVDRKVRLVERVAARGPERGGWERTGAEFKL